MKKILLSLSGACLVLSAASCSSEPVDTQGSGGSGMGASTSSGGNGDPAGSGSTSGTGGTLGGGGGTGSGSTGNGSGGLDSGNTGGDGAGTGSSPGSGGDGAGAGGSATGGEGNVVVERPPLVTSAEGAYWKVGELTSASGAANITVTATAKQKWTGFGGTFNEKGWDALSVLSESERDRAIKLLFSASEGANFAWGRIPIGASDYAMDRYTLNETAGDNDMVNFSIARDKMRLIPYIHAAQAVKSDIRFWGSPWTPPSWMKTPASIDGTDPDINGNNATFEAFMKEDATTLEAFALYLTRFVEEYATEGIVMDHIEPQNEPGYSSRYPSCRWKAGLLGTFVGAHLAPMFKEHQLDTDIWFGTLSNDNTYNDHIGGLTGDAAAAVKGVGLQWNTMSHVGTLAQQGYQVLQTEHRCGNYPFTVTGAPAFNPNKPPNDYAYAIESWGYLRDWIKAGVNAYSAWNMVLDTEGKNLDAVRPWPQNALLVVDRTAKTLAATPTYYVFRHFSYFVDPGADRLDVTGGDAVAFKNPDGSTVVILYNSGASAAQTNVAVGGTTVGVQVPGKGFATIHVEAS